MKILKLLYTYQQLHTSGIVSRLGVNYGLAIRQLRILERETVVQPRKSGYTRFFRFANTLKTNATFSLIKEWEKDANHFQPARATGCLPESSVHFGSDRICGYPDRHQRHTFF